MRSATLLILLLGCPPMPRQPDAGGGGGAGGGAGGGSGGGSTDAGLTCSTGLSFRSQRFGTGSNPWFITAADFNRDGKLDLATANEGSGDISVLLGNGDGTFSLDGGQPIGRSPRALATADFNRDGILDIVAGTSGDLAADRLSIVLGNGDGTFSAAVGYFVGLAPFSVTAADFNGDGKVDVATANAHSDDVSVLLGNGDGTFGGTESYPVRTPVFGLMPWSVTHGDFDGDGRLDLATGNYFPTACVSVLLGVGDGTFLAAVHHEVGTSAVSIIAADFDADGRLDLATADTSGEAWVLLGNADGGPPIATGYSAGSYAYSVASGDLDGDGTLDLVTANVGGNDLTVLLGTGDAGFGAAVHFPVGSSPHSVVTADFNSDGALDLAAANGTDDDVSVLINCR